MARRIVFDVGETAPNKGAVSVPATPDVKKPDAAPVPQAAQEIAKKFTPAFEPGQTTIKGVPIKGTSSFTPTTAEQKYYWEQYVEKYGRYPSKPDLMVFIPRARALEKLQNYFLDKLAEHHVAAQTVSPGPPSADLRTRIQDTYVAATAKHFPTTARRTAVYLNAQFEHLGSLLEVGALSMSGAQASLAKLAYELVTLGDDYYVTLLPLSVIDKAKAQAEARAKDNAKTPRKVPYGIDSWEHPIGFVPGMGTYLPMGEITPEESKPHGKDSIYTKSFLESLQKPTFVFPATVAGTKFIVVPSLPDNKAYQVGDTVYLTQQMLDQIRKDVQNDVFKQM